MSQKTVKILSYVALVFMGIFTISFILFLFDPNMLGGVIAFITLFSGVIGIGLYFLLRSFIKKEDPANDADDELPEKSDTLNDEEVLQAAEADDIQDVKSDD